MYDVKITHIHFFLFKVLNNFTLIADSFLKNLILDKVFVFVGLTAPKSKRIDFILKLCAFLQHNY